MEELYPGGEGGAGGGGAFELIRTKIQIAYLRLKIAFLSERAAREKAQADADREKIVDQRHSLLMAQIGLMTTKWAAMETMVNLIIGLLHQNGGQAISKKAPTGMEAKLAYFRKAADKIPSLRNLHADIEQLCTAISAIKEIRHSLTHGMAQIAPADPEITMRRVTLKNGMIETIEDRMTHDAILASCLSVSDAARWAIELAANVAMALGHGEIETVFRNLARANELVDASHIVGAN